MIHLKFPGNARPRPTIVTNPASASTWNRARTCHLSRGNDGSKHTTFILGVAFLWLLLTHGLNRNVEFAASKTTTAFLFRMACALSSNHALPNEALGCANAADLSMASSGQARATNPIWASARGSQEAMRHHTTHGWGNSGIWSVGGCELHVAQPGNHG